ncbi:MAG: penicillin acylase family protein [Microscillaceae bacterium]|nr:penicillin acylase family protein [Microscillaceae bacterium]
MPFFPKGRQKDRDKGIGSNNWAVGAEKSATGYPILCNDPHLTLTLPSIWFEIQLVAPKLNVYGVSLPGAPGVIVGFNKEVAWGLTNVDTDVTDWYSITFKDASRQQYKYGEEWRDIRLLIDTLRVRGQAPVLDTLLFTHYGPITAQAHEAQAPWVIQDGIPADCALRWVAHEPSQELLTFYYLNRARNYKDYRQALTYYTAPAQNFIFADVHKDIAITPNGKFPLKWREQGKFVLDGSNPAHEWQGWIPYAQNPHIKNPSRGFVSSANQFPVVDSLYPYYLNWEYATFERGQRINERLTQLQKVNPDSMRFLQYDALSAFAREALPLLLAAVPRNALQAQEQKCFDLLATWDYQFKAEQIAPSIFNQWWANFAKATWEDELALPQMRFPNREMTLGWMARNDSLNPVVWFDDRRTPARETLGELARQTLRQTVKSLTEKYGPLGDAWQWTKVRATRIDHLARIAAFGKSNIISDGDKTAVNALSTSNGPSWRMVVALGRKPEAYGIYPGGQSGNPGSFFYDNMLQDWSQGRLARLLFLSSPQTENNEVVAKIKMNP